MIAIGGGGIQRMRKRWVNALAKYDEEEPEVQQAAQDGKERIEQRAQTRLQQAKTAQHRPND